MRTAVIIEPGYANHTIEQDSLAPLGFEVRSLVWGGDRERLKDGVRDAEIVFVRDTILDGDVLSAMCAAKGIVRYGIGVDTIDLVAAKARSIKVANVREYGAEIEVADHALALYLAVRRRIVTRDRDVRRGAWQVGQREPIGRVAGSTLGLIGYGRIAKAVQRRFAAFEVEQVAVFDPFIPRNTAPPPTIRMVSLPELAATADIISIHAPATMDNRHMIGAEFFGALKPGGILVNTARGPIVDEAALIQALRDGTLFGAGLDVFETEPPAGSPLLTLDNVVLSDHAAWYSEATVAAIQRGAVEQALQIIANGSPTNWVNP